MLSNIDDKFWEIELDVADQAPQVLGQLETIVKMWWNEWSKRAFPLMLPRTKWAVKHRNVKVGNIVHLQYKSTMSRDRYRLARIEVKRCTLTSMG